jgi:hypothetical protein
MVKLNVEFTINETLRVLCGSDRIQPLMVNRRREFNFLNSEFSYTNFEKLEDCI